MTLITIGLMAMFAADAVPPTHPTPPTGTPAAATPSMEPYTQRIPGTAVTFDMVPIPGTSIWMGRTEVTWDEFEQYYLVRPVPNGVDGIAQPTRSFEAHDWGWGRGKRPAVSISRYTAEMYCRWLSARTGHVYRLPTEAEWEHAARAGGDGDYFYGDDPASLGNFAWYRDNSDEMTHEVGLKKPNAYGLVDVLGNAAEYCSGDEVVARGGSWSDGADRLRLETRLVERPMWNYRDPNDPPSKWWRTDAAFVGFRVVREKEAISH